MTATATRTASPSLLRDLFELLGSMRFAISLLVFICIASLVGTVLPQNRPANTYIDQFGPFWYEVFDKFSLWHVYNSWWFPLTMAFLVLSTSICLIRNTPKMLRDAASFREHVRESSLRAFPERVQQITEESPQAALTRVRALLRGQGYAVRERQDAGGVLLAAKKGSSNRLGYVCAHAALIIICIGGLLDSELPVRLQVMFGGKQPIIENMLIAQVPPSGRLSPSNPSFRANVLVPEGAERNTALVMVGDGALVQPLPFTIKLKKFDVEYYSTGMPSRFASHVEVTDPETGKTFERLIEVNEPLRYKGVTVYQANLADGGSKVTLTGYPLRGAANDTFTVHGTVDEGNDLKASIAGHQTDSYKLNITALRPINVEDIGNGDPQPTQQSFMDHVASVTGSAAGRKNERLRNLGPVVEYQLVDEAGQSRDFRVYMAPVELNGLPVILAGVRDNPSQNYAYLRIPADADGTPGEFMKLRAALADPQVRAEAVRRFVERNLPAGTDRQALTIAASRGLDTFAAGGLRAVSELLQTGAGQADAERAAGVVLRLLNSTLYDVHAIMREREHLPPLPDSGPQAEAAAAWQQAAMGALSDLSLYPAPVLLTLSDFQQIQASGFQVARTPGKNAVYLGCLLLILGIFAMFYIRDRRIWVWIKPHGSGSEIQAAMTSQKRTLDFFQEFERFRAMLIGPTRGER
ncbi:cytochrome c biogenesis protein ResB [Bordetella avium]|uniref:C-type cytochrome bigenesis protein n=1 Tax=Bordetella avium (strain 197N) TaxID=360910 RepID=Q2L211_BORA1|nr:cytochrome c biogenesis protein ResB [Bordetella avium]AZY47748.1 cytochrome c biogenesis protein ResB [Bordetella avium]RIQ18483.1 cytochrome c biogenesis protein ResB [Bordetella avium]RIQ35481.1 cytochrome c biogenesis protein ResB [Bordetella avium]RIQ53880.1 cytochrome c biogenesis protein ResB [Bordetella avium]RIQ74262.1 cytochrome c biogenesis protein ResB [Bordetella avium]